MAAKKKKKQSTLERFTGSKSLIGRGAKKITKAVGAKNLAKFAGETLARRKNKSIKRTVTGKQARKSGVALAANIASLASGGAAAGIIRGIRVARKAKSAKSLVKKGFKVKGQKKRVKVRHFNIGKKKGVTYGNY